MVVMKTMPMPIMMTTSIPMTPLTMTITCMIYGADLSTRFVLSVRCLSPHIGQTPTIPMIIENSSLENLALQIQSCHSKLKPTAG